MNFVKSRDTYESTDVSRAHGQYQLHNYQEFNTPGFSQGQQRFGQPQSGPWQQHFNGPQGVTNQKQYMSSNSAGFNSHQQDFSSQHGIESYQQNLPSQGFEGYNQQNIGSFQQQGYNRAQNNFSGKQQGAMARRRYQGPQPKRNSLSDSSFGSNRPRQQFGASVQRFSRPQQGSGQYSSFVKAGKTEDAGEMLSQYDVSGPSSTPQAHQGGFERLGIASSKGRGGGGKNSNDDFAAVAAVTALAAQATRAAVNPDDRCVWLSNQGHFISKVQRLAMQVKSLRSERPNAVDQLHSAANKVRINIHIEIESGPVVKSTYTFFCLVQFDGVNVAVASALNKRAAKVEAYEVALKKIMMPFLRVVEINGTSKELQSSNVEFSNESVRQTVIKPTSAVVKGICGEEKLTGPSKRHSLQKESNAESIVHAKKRNYGAKDLNDFLLVEPIEHNSSVNGASILRRSADYSKMLLEYEFAAQPESTGAIRCIATVEGHILADIVASSKPAAKIKASEVAVDVLRQHCWTILTKQHHDTDAPEITKEEMFSELADSAASFAASGGAGAASSNAASINVAIPDSNLGKKMLQKMGWTGGGIGKDGTGIEEPVSMQQVINREGLGLSAAKGVPSEFRAKIVNMLEGYTSSDRQEDLVFSPTFHKEERMIIHCECRKLNLKSTSKGQGPDRFLIVRRKRSAFQLVDHIMANGGETARYKLVPPGQRKYPWQKIPHVNKVGMPWPDTKQKGEGGCAVAGQNWDPSSNPALNPNPSFNLGMNANAGYCPNPAGGIKQETGLLGTKLTPLMSLPLMGPSSGVMGGPGLGMSRPAFNRH